MLLVPIELPWSAWMPMLPGMNAIVNFLFTARAVPVTAAVSTPQRNSHRLRCAIAAILYLIKNQHSTPVLGDSVRDVRSRTASLTASVRTDRSGLSGLVQVT